MINRQNWQDVQRFLSFQEGTQQNDPLTVKRVRVALTHLLEWADSVPFGNVTRKEPTFPAYMAKKGFAFSGSEKTLQITRQFFDFARSEWPPRYKNIVTSWVRTIQPSKKNSSQSRLKKHYFFPLGDVLKIAAKYHTAESLELKRDIAGACFLFLSGMRISAFASLPLECVNVKENEVFQLPEKGVMTKNRKAAVTYLLQVPELLNVVTAWDELIRKELSPADLWYPVMRSNSDRLHAGKIATLGRRKNFAKALKNICSIADVPYLSPHKLRHGHVVYALKNVKDMAGLKAVSQNVMHASIQITDSIYGNLSDGDVKRIVSSIGQDAPAADATAPADLSNLLALLSNPDVQKLIATFNGNAQPKPKTKKGK